MSVNAPASSVIDAGRADAIVQLLIASRRTLAHANVLTDHADDTATAALIAAAMDAIGTAMNQRILGGHQ